MIKRLRPANKTDLNLWSYYCELLFSALYLIASYIALQLCSINRSLVGEFFIIFLILLTISFWFSIWKLEKALANNSQCNSKDLDPKTGNFCTFT